MLMTSCVSPRRLNIKDRDTLTAELREHVPLKETGFIGGASVGGKLGSFTAVFLQSGISVKFCRIKFLSCIELMTRRVGKGRRNC